MNLLTWYVSDYTRPAVICASVLEHAHCWVLSFTHIKIFLSLIKSSTADRLEKTMLIMRKKNAPALLWRQRQRERGEAWCHFDTLLNFKLFFIQVFAPRWHPVSTADIIHRGRKSDRQSDCKCQQIEQSRWTAGVFCAFVPVLHSLWQRQGDLVIDGSHQNREKDAETQLADRSLWVPQTVPHCPATHDA